MKLRVAAHESYTGLNFGVKVQVATLVAIVVLYVGREGDLIVSIDARVAGTIIIPLSVATDAYRLQHILIYFDPRQILAADCSCELDVNNLVVKLFGGCFGYQVGIPDAVEVNPLILISNCDIDRPGLDIDLTFVVCGEEVQDLLEITFDEYDLWHILVPGLVDILGELPSEHEAQVR